MTDRSGAGFTAFVQVLKSALFLVTAAWWVAACGSELDEPNPSESMSPPEMTPTEEPPVETPPEEMPPEEMPPVWQIPEVVAPATIMEDLNTDPDIVEVNLTAAPIQHTLYDGFTIDMYAYNGQIPGPLLQAKVGDEVIIHFRNDLPEPTTVHWHGLRIPDDMDGSPRVMDPVPAGEEFTYHFVVPDAGSFWYHPHVRTNEQIEKGLYGTLIVHDPADPIYDRERFVVLDDILVNNSGISPFFQGHMEAMHGRNGNLLLTNGTAEDVRVTAEQGTVERWRLVNTANARTMSLSIEGAEWRVVGTDGGRLREAYTTDRLTLPVGQRYDVEVRYHNAGEVVLSSHVLVLDEKNNVVERPFAVYTVDVSESDKTMLDVVWPEMPAAEPRETNVTTTFELEAYQDNLGNIRWTINGMAHPMEPLATYQQGDTVRLFIKNNLGPEHPFHLHGQFFEIVPDGRAFTQQPGLKDTVLVPGLERIEIKAYMDNPGRWMAHCHILEHAELGMMGEFLVNPTE